MVVCLVLTASWMDPISVLCCCRSIDYGSVYASKTFQTQDGRRVWMGWVFETSSGCVEQCSAGTNFTDSLVRAV